MIRGYANPESCWQLRHVFYTGLFVQIRPLFHPEAITLYTLTVLLGGMFALVAPTLSLFLANDIGARPFAVGGFFVALALASILWGQAVAKKSDHLHRRHGLIFSGMCAGGIACIIFSWSDHYWAIVFAGVTLLAFSNAVLPQLFALTREYADQNLAPESTTLFNALVRSCIAVAWVAAPPLGFYLHDHMGPQTQYFAIGIAYICAGLAAYFTLPNVRRKITLERKPDNLSQSRSHQRTNLVLAMVAFALLFAANHAYQLGLPLLVTNELGGAPVQCGWLMGSAAAMEIPVMILTGWLASRVALIHLLRFGCAAGIALYFLIWQADAIWQLFAVQILNALYVGCIAGLGITFFQNALPGQAGVASTLFTHSNQLGNVLGSLFISVFAELYGYQEMYALNMFAACAAMAALWMIRTESRQKTEISTLASPPATS